MKHTVQTFISTLAALALAAAFLVSANSFAGEYMYYRGDGEPTVMARGNAHALGRLGFRYENGLGVPQDFILSYKWLDLAAARGVRRERDFYLRLRDAVASKMSLAQVVEGQRLALIWAGHRSAERGY